MKVFARENTVKVTSALVLASLLLAHACFRLLPRVLETWNAQIVDKLFQLRSGSETFRPRYDKTVVHVDLNNTTIHQLNNFYLNRSHYARVVRNLAAMGAGAQVYDFIFAARSGEEEDRALIDAVRSAGSAYFGVAFSLAEGQAGEKGFSGNSEALRFLDRTLWKVAVKGDPSFLPTGIQALPTFPELASASRGLGFLSIRPDDDGIFRRVPLLVRYNDGFYPSLPFRVVCDYLRVAPEKIEIVPGRSITLRDATGPDGQTRDVKIPIDARGNMIVNFIGPWERMNHYSFADVFRASDDRDELDLWREELSGKIILLSDVTTGSADIGPVPTDVNFPLSGLHANVMHTILTGQFLRELDGFEMFGVELALTGFLLLLAVTCSPLVFSLGMVALGAVYLGTVAACFLYGGIVLHALRPLFLLLFAAGSVSGYGYLSGEKEKEVLRRTFESYFAPSVVRKIMANPHLIAEGGQKKELTVLFSDIKSFSTHSAGLAPDVVQRFLNEYFEAMVDIAFSYEGTVDKYIGDGFMVFFGDPEPQEDHAQRCVRAAIAMQKKARELDALWQKREGIPLRIRIGINTGEMIVGNMGSARRLSYTVLGAAVNLAQRLETSAPVGGILIGPATYEKICGEIAVRPLGEMSFKGLDVPVNVYEVPLGPEEEPADR